LFGQYARGGTSRRSQELAVDQLVLPNKLTGPNMSHFVRTGVLLSAIIAFLQVIPVQAQEWRLVWSDEFDGDSLDLTKWSFQYGTGTSEGLVGWGNNELQYYTDREANIFVADGKLHIVARQEAYMNRNYTSARIRSIHNGDWKYGRFEIRAKLPEGRGLWPAIWMMPTENVYGGWAASGEIDIVELVGHEPDVVHGTLHYGGRWPNNVHRGARFQLQEGKFSDDFHTFTLLWREGEMRWFVNGIYYQNQNSWFTAGHDFPAPFDQRFHFILNVAVGGNWPGSPNHTTVFPQEMVIDYIRVYQLDTSTSFEDDEEEVPQGYHLQQNHPNPFHSATSIEFSLPKTSYVMLDVFDIMGRHVSTLSRGYHPAGRHRVEFDASTLPAGFYSYRISTGSYYQARQMIIVR
jgi:beta-glucanase (GH16 family)